jgi:hypothetical protein
MAEKILRNRTQFTTTLRNDLYLSLEEMSDDIGIPKTKLLDKGMELLIEDFINKGMYEPRGSQHTPQSNKNQR